MSKLRPTYSFMKRLDFLSSGKVYMKDSVKTITLSYETRGTSSNGLRFVRCDCEFTSCLSLVYV